VKNYVAMSPDYDGTVDASFLCNPEKLVASNIGTFVKDSLTDDAFGTDLEAILEIGAFPTSAGQFKLYLLGLLPGEMPTWLASSNTTNSSSGSATGIEVPSASAAIQSWASGSTSSNSPTSVAVASTKEQCHLVRRFKLKKTLVPSRRRSIDGRLRLRRDRVPEETHQLWRN
jgi:hypothetical protein